MALNLAQIEKLERDFRAGFRITHVAQKRGISQTTVSSYFADFTQRGIPRKALTRYRERGAFDPPVPSYSGPTMIGRAISSPPIQAGPDWIGNRIHVA